VIRKVKNALVTLSSFEPLPRRKLYEDALTIINRQQAHIKQWQEAHDKLVSTIVITDQQAFMVVDAEHITELQDMRDTHPTVTDHE
jgi:alanine dehydrogenase